MGWADIGDVKCGHCGVMFQPTPRQIKRVKYESASVYCSKLCRVAATTQKLRKPLSGPCATCGSMFHSRGTAERRFCSMACYMVSDQLRIMLVANSPKAARAAGKKAQQVGTKEIACLHCGATKRVRKSISRKFCSAACYRGYMAERFDRWVASPQSIALPQGYDEFLAQEHLPCLVDGCEWVGQHLSVHMNWAHGVPADEFKRAAGFNLGSGIVAAPLHAHFTAAPHNPDNLPPESAFPLRDRRPRTTYRSLEGEEHRAKARALAKAGGAA